MSPTALLSLPSDVPAVVVLGADAVLAALPATAVQLAHACLAAGWRSAVPATWGDELVAKECLTQLAGRSSAPAVLCACPRVRDRLCAGGTDLSRVVIATVSPPVATARYLRGLAGDAPVHVTFVGSCPSARDGSFDAVATPAELLAALRARGIEPREQPTVFDSVLPPDRRRHLSLPGGVPSAEALWTHGTGRRLVELTDDDYAVQLAEHLLNDDAVLIDLAPALGCACSGAAEGISPRNARHLIASLEPPRAPSPVVDATVPISLAPPSMPTEPGAAADGGAAPAAPRERPAPPARREAHEAFTRLVSPRRAPPGHGVAGSAARTPSLTPASAQKRRTPVGLSRLTTTIFPMARSGGRLLPRAYVARRHSLPSLPAVPARPGRGENGSAMAGAAVATPPEATPLTARTTSAAGAPAHDPASPIRTREDYAHFVAGVQAIVARHVRDWRALLDAAIRFWQQRGYRTDVLERARALEHAPDIEGLLTTYAAAVEHLGRLEALATSAYPELRGRAVFRNPERVEAAERFVDRLFVENE